MKIEIVSQNDNKLLGRKEINADISFDAATPNRKQLRETLGGKVGANPELIVIRKLKNKYGVKEINVTVHAYENAEVMKKNEPYHVLVRDGLAPKKEKKKKEKKAPAPKKKE